MVRVMMVAAVAAAVGAFASFGSRVAVAASPAPLQIPQPPTMIRGVSLGNWFILEKYLGDSVFQGSGQPDEWGLCQELGYNACQDRLQDHWDNYVTQQDLKNIKDAGLNSVRIPIGYWAVEQQPNEPYVNGQIPVLLKVLGWCQDIGLTAQIDLHSVPGAQSGGEDTGHIQADNHEHWTDIDPDKSITLRILGKLTSVVADHLASNGGPVITIEVVNEPDATWADKPIANDWLRDYYTRAYATVHSNTGGKDVGFVFFDQWNIDQWDDFMPTSENFYNVYLDTHQYFAFDNPPITNYWDALAELCQKSGPSIIRESGKRWMIVGEWALTVGNPGDWNGDYGNFLKQFAETQIHLWESDGAGGQGGWYYWNFKAEGGDQNTWSYQGLRNLNIMPDMNNGVPPNHCPSFLASEKGQRYVSMMDSSDISAEAITWRLRMASKRRSGGRPNPVRNPHLTASHLATRNATAVHKPHHVHHSLRKAHTTKP